MRQPTNHFLRVLAPSRERNCALIWAWILCANKTIMATHWGRIFRGLRSWLYWCWTYWCNHWTGGRIFWGLRSWLYWCWTCWCNHRARGWIIWWLGGWVDGCWTYRRNHWTGGWVFRGLWSWLYRCWTCWCNHWTRSRNTRRYLRRKRGRCDWFKKCWLSVTSLVGKFSHVHSYLVTQCYIGHSEQHSEG